MTGVRYLEAAEDELLNEIGYLELRIPGLGRRFFGEVRRVEALISQFPESAPELLPGIRKQILRKFPFAPIYSIENEGLFVLAVAHHSRQPRYWVPRASQAKDEPKPGA